MQPNPRRLVVIIAMAVVLSLDWTYIFQQMDAVLEGLKRNRWLAHGPSSIASTILGIETQQQKEQESHQKTMSSEVQNRRQTVADVSQQVMPLRNEFRAHVMQILKTSCLPKLICELHAVTSSSLSNAEKSLLKLLRDTSIGTVAEVTSRYHFAAHMGQLVAGVEGTGCHNFYPNCPLGGRQVLDLLSPLKLK